MPSFSQLLKNSRLSKFDPALSQVYKTYGEYHQRGEYGLKRILPNHLRTTVDTINSTLTVRGLTYSHNDPGVNFQIQGRILNRDSNGVYAVGISGLVGRLHFGKAQRLAHVNRKKLDNFYVEKV